MCTGESMSTWTLSSVGKHSTSPSFSSDSVSRRRATLGTRADYTDMPAAGQRTPCSLKDKDLMSLKDGIGPATF